jgi:hypothetical protein
VVGPYRVSGATPVLDDDVLSDLTGECLCDLSTDDVGRAACGCRHDERNWPCRIRLRMQAGCTGLNDYSKQNS